MIWTDGKLIPPEELRIDIRDETFQHGLGLFETFRTWRGNPTLFPRHLERLVRSARELELEIQPHQLPDRRAVLDLIEANRTAGSGRIEDVRIRITMTGGAPASKPYRRHSTLWMTAEAPMSMAPEQVAVIERTMEVTVDDPLTRHKTLNYWRKRIAHREALREGSQEVLCITPDGMVCEGTRTNIFLVQGGGLITPSTDGPLLPGILRRVVLDHAHRLEVPVVESPVPLEMLETVNEAFLTNSVRGMLPISRFFDRDLPAPGPVTERLWREILPWLESGGTTR